MLMRSRQGMAPAGTSSTGTILAQAPAAGSKVDQGQFVQVTVSGY